jgi:hypothetical protein
MLLSASSDVSAKGEEGFSPVSGPPNLGRLVGGDEVAIGLWQMIVADFCTIKTTGFCLLARES